MYIPVPKQNKLAKECLLSFRDTKKIQSTDGIVGKLDKKKYEARIGENAEEYYYEGRVNSFRVNQRMEHLAKIGLIEEYRLIDGNKHDCGSSEYVIQLQRLKNLVWDRVKTKWNIAYTRWRDAENSGDEHNEHNAKNEYEKYIDELCKLEDISEFETALKTLEGTYVSGRELWSLVCYKCGKTIHSPDERFKVLSKRAWELTFDGEMLVFSTFRPDIPRKYIPFLENRKGNRLLNLARLLIGYGKKSYVSKLIKDLKSENKMTHLVGTRANKWYNDMNSMIGKWQIDANRFPELAKYKYDLNNPYTRKIIMPSRRHR